MKKRVATSLSVFLILLAGCGGDPQPGDQSLSADTSSQLDNQPEVQPPATNASTAPENPPVTDKNEDKPAADFTPGVFLGTTYRGDESKIELLADGKIRVSLNGKLLSAFSTYSWRVVGNEVVVGHDLDGSKLFLKIHNSDTLIDFANSNSEGMRKEIASNDQRTILSRAGSDTAPPDTSSNRMRTWQDASGQFSIKAVLLRVADDQAVLEGADKKELIVPLTKLSLADRQYIVENITHLTASANEQEVVFALVTLGAKGIRWKEGHVSEISLATLKLADAAVVYLNGLTNLTRIDLHNTQISDAGLTHLKGLTNLTRINLSNTQISDAGLMHLKGLTNLTRIDLSNTQIDGTGLQYLKELTNLEYISLWGSPITDAGLEYLKDLTNLRLLSIWGTPITDTGLAHLSGLTNLQTLALSKTKITDAGLGHLKGLSNLATLHIHITDFTDVGLEHLKGLTNLTSISLSTTKITDAGLVHLKGLTNLEGLDLLGTKVTDAAVTELKKALPNCKILH